MLNQLSFPLVGNLSSGGFWTSQNDIFGTNTTYAIDFMNNIGKWRIKIPRQLFLSKLSIFL